MTSPREKQPHAKTPHIAVIFDETNLFTISQIQQSHWKSVEKIYIRAYWQIWFGRLRYVDYVWQVWFDNFDQVGLVKYDWLS